MGFVSKRPVAWLSLAVTAIRIQQERIRGSGVQVHAVTGQGKRVVAIGNFYTLMEHAV